MFLLIVHLVFYIKLAFFKLKIVYIQCQYTIIFIYLQICNARVLVLECENWFRRCGLEKIEDDLSRMRKRPLTHVNAHNCTHAHTHAYQLSAKLPHLTF